MNFSQHSTESARSARSGRSGRSAHSVNTASTNGNVAPRGHGTVASFLCRAVELVLHGHMLAAPSSRTTTTTRRRRRRRRRTLKHGRRPHRQDKDSNDGREEDQEEDEVKDLEEEEEEEEDLEEEEEEEVTKLLLTGLKNSPSSPRPIKGEPSESGMGMERKEDENSLISCRSLDHTLAKFSRIMEDSVSAYREQGGNDDQDDVNATPIANVPTQVMQFAILAPWSKQLRDEFLHPWRYDPCQPLRLDIFASSFDRCNSTSSSGNARKQVTPSLGRLLESWSIAYDNMLDMEQQTDPAHNTPYALRHQSQSRARTPNQTTTKTKIFSISKREERNRLVTLLKSILSVVATLPSRQTQGRDFPYNGRLKWRLSFARVSLVEDELGNQEQQMFESFQFPRVHLRFGSVMLKVEYRKRLPSSLSHVSEKAHSNDTGAIKEQATEQELSEPGTGAFELSDSGAMSSINTNNTNHDENDGNSPENDIEDENYSLGSNDSVDYEKTEKRLHFQPKLVDDHGKPPNDKSSFPPLPAALTHTQSDPMQIPASNSRRQRRKQGSARHSGMMVNQYSLHGDISDDDDDDGDDDENEQKLHTNDGFRGSKAYNGDQGRRSNYTRRSHRPHQFPASMPARIGPPDDLVVHEPITVEKQDANAIQPDPQPMDASEKGSPPVATSATTATTMAPTTTSTTKTTSASALVLPNSAERNDRNSNFSPDSASASDEARKEQKRLDNVSFGERGYPTRNFTPPEYLGRKHPDSILKPPKRPQTWSPSLPYEMQERPAQNPLDASSWNSSNSPNSPNSSLSFSRRQDTGSDGKTAAELSRKGGESPHSQENKTQSTALVRRRSQLSLDRQRGTPGSFGDRGSAYWGSNANASYMSAAQSLMSNASTPPFARGIALSMSESSASSPSSSSPTISPFLSSTPVEMTQFIGEEKFTLDPIPAAVNVNTPDSAYPGWNGYPNYNGGSSRNSSSSSSGGGGGGGSGVTKWQPHSTSIPVRAPHQFAKHRPGNSMRLLTESAHHHQHAYHKTSDQDQTQQQEIAELRDDDVNSLSESMLIGFPELPVVDSTDELISAIIKSSTGASGNVDGKKCLSWESAIERFSGSLEKANVDPRSAHYFKHIRKMERKMDEELDLEFQNLGESSLPFAFSPEDELEDPTDEKGTDEKETGEPETEENEKSHEKSHENVNREVEKEKGPQVHKNADLRYTNKTLSDGQGEVETLFNKKENKNDRFSGSSPRPSFSNANASLDQEWLESFLELTRKPPVPPTWETMTSDVDEEALRDELT